MVTDDLDVQTGCSQKCRHCGGLISDGFALNVHPDVKFHPNCNYLATASADKTVRLWSHADAKMVR